MKKYRTWYFGSEITEVEIERETDKTVVIGDRRYHKRTEEFYNFFNTWQEAHDFLVSNAQTKIAILESQAERTRETLKKLQEMSQPCE